MLETQFINISGYGICLYPKEFKAFSGKLDSIEVHNARESPKELHNRLIEKIAIVLTGPYLYINGFYRYCMHYERELVPEERYAHIEDHYKRISAFTEERRQKLYHILLFAQGDSLIEVQNPPDTIGLQQWLQEPTGDSLYLIPLRRLQRILTDMRRAREGIFLDILNGTITILPHVYVPADISVPTMFAQYGEIMKDKKILDMGTGTGVLAIMAAKFGADKVIATDINPNSVANAKLNVQRFGLSSIIEVRGPQDLFNLVKDEKFDIILFNAPWIQGEPQTLYDTANYDFGYRVLEGFLQEAPQHLNNNGLILLQYSDISQRKGENSISHLLQTIELCRLRIVGEKSLKRKSRVIGTQEHVFIFEIKIKESEKNGR